MQKSILVRVAAAIALALVATGVVASPPAAALDVYTTPGVHELNGRTWRTECSQYSSSVRRCRTDIIATTVTAVSTGFRSTTGWTFNNLTYLPSPRAQWTGNPLATPGTHMIDGRRWRTECDTPTTGRNGCRSYIEASVVDVISRNPVRHGWRTKWIFNNMVRFSTSSNPSQPTNPPAPINPPAPTTACTGVPLPAGFRVGKDGMPSPPASSQFPANSYNPQYISNFIRKALADSRTSTSQKKCLATTAAQHLVARSTTRIVDGATSRWFPFNYTYSANPAVPSLQAPWYSGLAQANVLTTTALMEDLTGDAMWRRYGRETFESFLVPDGFTSREKGSLWFEEYPTKPGTSVLNGHLEALIGLAWWGQNRNEPRATALLDEAIDGLRPLLEASEVDVEAGLLTSYDLVRGYPAAPLRLLGSPGFRWDQAKLNGNPHAIPTVASVAPASRNVLRNSDMSAVSNSLPSYWKSLDSRSQVSAVNGVAKVVTNSQDWQGLVQTVAQGTFAAGEPLHLSARSRLTLPTGGAGTSGKIMAYEQCSGRYKVLHTTTKLRSQTWAHYDLTFPAPRAGCALEIRLTSGLKTPSNTIIEFDDVTLSRADEVGKAAKPAYDLRVDRTPANTLTFTGVGQATLQAHRDGGWQDVADVVLSPGAPTTVTIPERFTGRNLHYGYHESHVSELMQLHKMTGNPLFLEFARRWAPLAPAHNGLVPPR